MSYVEIDPGAFPPEVRALYGIGASEEAAVTLSNCSRRGFLKTTALAAGSVFVLGITSGRRAEAAAALPEGLTDAAFRPNVFVALDADGTVWLVNSRAEMGQGTKTGMIATLADEMDADWARVRPVQAEGHERYGPQSTGGSTSVRLYWQDWRKAGATARAMLVSAAAATWAVSEAECETVMHAVRHRPTGRVLGYGELAAKAATLPVPTEPRLKDRSEWRYIGKPLHGVDNRAIASGKAVFGADVRLPGMKYAVVARPPVLGGSARSFDDSAARAVPGVVDVFELPRYQGAPGNQALGGFAVVATNTWAAMKGRDALRIVWDPGPNAVYSSDTYKDVLLDSVAKPGRVERDQGDVDAAFAGAARTVEATYTTAMLSHAQLEPPATVAWLKPDGSAEMWCSTQNPQSARTLAAEAFGIPKESLTLHMTLMGGAFGRKGLLDFAPEAALVAKRVDGPVCVQWTREDDMRHGYYHPPAAQYLKAGIDAGGKVTAWLHRSSYPAIGATFTEGELYGGTQGSKEVLFAVPNLRVENGPAPAHVRIGWLRSVMAVHHGFGIGAFVGELAHALGKDQVEMWLELLGPDRTVTELFTNGRGPYGEPIATHPIDSGRMRRVIELAAEKAGWGRRLPAGHGMGVAAHYSFWGYAAFVVHASVEGTRVRVHRVDASIDCGTVVNPDRVRAQQEGAVVFSLSHALYGEVLARDGAVTTGNYDEFRLLALKDTPETHVHIVESTAPPGGVGEPGIPPMMPALTNAVLAATGRPVRELPIRLG